MTRAHWRAAFHLHFNANECEDEAGSRGLLFYDELAAWGIS